MQRSGWVSPRDNDSLVYSINHQLLLFYRSQQKLLPGSVATPLTRIRAQELEDRQGSKRGPQTDARLQGAGLGRPAAPGKSILRAEADGTDTSVGPAALPYRVRRLTCRQTVFLRLACW
ncbi:MULTISPECIES: recombination-associated protein RdgC [unclassified Paraburkholderia]|uniref:recombination-associated protein RdgC n=1 Tax=unclassified Paraburkholderia TaxID=2615204 RepID=UPI0038BA14F6